MCVITAFIKNLQFQLPFLSLLLRSCEDFRFSVLEWGKHTHTLIQTHTNQWLVLYLMWSWSWWHIEGLQWIHAHIHTRSALGSDNSGLGEKRKLRDRYVFFRMDRYGFGHAPLLQDTSVIGMEVGSPPPLTDYSYHLVRFHEAIICLHTPPTLGMADYRNTHYTASDGGKCLSQRKRKVVCRGSSSHRGIKVTVWGIFIWNK